MINTWEELGEILAEFENRLSLLENSMPYRLLKSEEEQKPQLVEHIVRHSDISRQDYASLRNLEGQVKYLQTKFDELLIKRGKSQPKRLHKTGGIQIE